MGTSLPTGENDESEMGVRIDEHAQLGRGAFAPYGGVLYAFHQDPWNVSASVTYRRFTENRHEYLYGSNLRWSLSFTYRPAERLAASIAVVGRNAARDHDDGVEVVNTGGLVLAVAPGILVNVAAGLWLHASAHLPIAQRLEGEQHVGPTYMASLQYAVR